MSVRGHARAEAKRRLYRYKYEEAKQAGHDWKCAGNYATSDRIGVPTGDACICCQYCKGRTSSLVPCPECG